MTGAPGAPLATNTLQRIIVDRPLIVDVPYTFFTGSELVFTQSNANLDVQSTLTLRGTHLHGCQVIWDGIFVRNGAFFHAFNNCIEDGLQAIRLFNGANYEIVRNNFQRNLVSIFAGEPDQTASDLWQVGNGISGNDISGLAPLIQAVQGATRPRIGIDINRVNEMSVGLPGTNPVLQNAIHDFGAPIGSGTTVFGISSINSNLIVSNTRFFNIGEGVDEVGGVAINASSIGLQYVLNVTGLGGLQQSPATFQNCQAGIRSQDNILSVRRSRFDGAIEHIRMNFPAFPHRFRITDNYFEQYRDLGVSANVGVYRNGTVENNIFEDQWFVKKSVAPI